MRPLIILILASCLSLSAADWPMYLRDLPHSSFAPDETAIQASNVGRMRQLWKTSAGAPISAAATVVGGVVYYGAWDGNFYALDAGSGAVLWSTFVGVAPTPSDPTCQPGIGVAGQAVVADRVYVPGGDSAIYALNLGTGAVEWRQQIAEPTWGAYLWSSVMLSDNALFVGIASLGDCPRIQGAVARIPLDAPSQTLIRYLVPSGVQGAGVWSTPALDEQAGLVYVTTGDADSQSADQGIWGSALLALDAVTLEIKAHFFLPVPDGEIDVDFGSSPTLFQTADGSQYVAASGKDGVLYVLNRSDLSLAWSSKLSRDCIDPQLGCGALSTPAFDGQTLYAGAGISDMSGGPPGFVYAFDPVTRGVSWVYPARGIVIAPVTVVPGLVFVPTMSGLAVVDATTGAELWTDSGGALVSQCSVANGVLYCTYYNGDVVAWKPDAPPGRRIIRR